jgi:hypothetical protein
VYFASVTTDFVKNVMTYASYQFGPIENLFMLQNQNYNQQESIILQELKSLVIMGDTL